MFGHGYATFNVHNTEHVGEQVAKWGNVWESWQFVIERTAGVFTNNVQGHNF